MIERRMARPTRESELAKIKWLDDGGTVARRPTSYQFARLVRVCSQAGNQPVAQFLELAGRAALHSAMAVAAQPLRSPKIAEKSQ